MAEFKNLSDLTTNLSPEQDFISCFEKLRWNDKIISPFDPNSKATPWVFCPIFETALKNSVEIDKTFIGGKNKNRHWDKKVPHSQVNHSAKEYVNEKAHTNSVENFWSHLKRGIYGTYHWTSRKHLHSYIDEFTLRYNTRNKNKTMDKKIPCDACGFYLDEVYMHKNENGKTYCTSCELLINSNEDLDKIEPVSQEDLEKNLKTLLNTPPLK
ncbi:2810_t:CDS:2 [Entrophospora sp. SA101]|nr:2810_t:CDS:2 [Entrophospora sp. SA101]CAJ0847669.1 3129_t:CDS:2 [Entrophospora sp. SA101]